MNAGTWKVGLLALIAFAAQGSVQALNAQDDDPPPASAYRTALMQSMRHHVGALRALVGGDVPYEGHVAHHAEAVAGIAAMAGDAFPEGTGGEGTRASTDIWDNWDDFLTQYSALRTAADALSAGAQAGDMSAVEAALSDVGSTCRGCHQPYRLPAN
ncbi:MAG: c-type cytochrome [Longimicrobiales bacterium]